MNYRDVEDRGQVCAGESHLNVQTLGGLHILCDVQTFVPTQRPHKGGQRLLILTEPLQLCTRTHVSRDSLNFLFLQ